MNWFERQEHEHAMAKLRRLEEENAQLRKDVEDYSAENERQRELMLGLRDALAAVDACDSAEDLPPTVVDRVRAAIESVASILPEVKT